MLSKKFSNPVIGTSISVDTNVLPSPPTTNSVTGGTADTTNADITLISNGNYIDTFPIYNTNRPNAMFFGDSSKAVFYSVENNWALLPFAYPNGISQGTTSMLGELRNSRIHGTCHIFSESVFYNTIHYPSSQSNMPNWTAPTLDLLGGHGLQLWSFDYHVQIRCSRTSWWGTRLTIKGFPNKNDFWS